jgi:hypothetical protein
VFPAYLTRPIDIGFREYPAYRLFLIASGAVIALLNPRQSDRKRDQTAREVYS